MLLSLRKQLALVAIAFSTLLGSCSISPKPEPPEEPTVQFGFVGTVNPLSFGPCLVTGAAGAVKPALGIVRIYNLDDTLPPVDTQVKEDGSFEAEVSLNDGNELRLQVIDEDKRSAPIDVIASKCGDPLQLASRALAQCLTLVPAVQLDMAKAQSVSVANQCASSVQIEAPRLRRTIAGLEVGQGSTWPAVLQPGQSLSVQVTFQPASDREEIVFIEASAPEHDRRPVTVIATSP